MFEIRSNLKHPVYFLLVCSLDQRAPRAIFSHLISERSQENGILQKINKEFISLSFKAEKKYDPKKQIRRNRIQKGSNEGAKAFITQKRKANMSINKATVYNVFGVETFQQRTKRIPILYILIWYLTLIFQLFRSKRSKKTSGKNISFVNN